MMKVLLLFKPNTPIVNTQQNVIPNGLLYIGALLLDRNIDAEVLNLSDKDWDECRDLIERKDPDIVGISCYTFNRHTCMRLAALVKGISGKILVVFGGPHSSIMYGQLLGSKDIDAIVLNEGEMAFLDIVERLKEGKSFEGIPGVVYRSENKAIKNGSRQVLEDLDKLPIPAKYFQYKRIITSRGCPGRCIFCDTPCLWGHKVRLRSAKNVVDELEILNKKYGISSFIISDDTFTFDKKRTIGICKEIIRRGLKITWDCRSRVNFVCEERLRWMKKAGCVIISYGIESGSQKILDNLKKGITVEQIKKAALLARKFGLIFNYFIIVGSPGETDDTIRETMRLIEETRPPSVFTYIMQLTPGTEICKIAKEHDFIKDADWIGNEAETIFYTRGKSLKELVRYSRLINELCRLFKERSSYSEDEIKEVMEDEKGVQDLINMAQIKLRGKRLGETEKILDEAIQLNPGSSEALMDMGVVLAMKKDENCIGFFNRAIRADPENLMAYRNLGLFLFKAGRCDEAIDVFKKAIEIEPADIKSYNELGQIYGLKERYDEAIKIFRRALSIDNSNRDILRNLALTYDKKEKGKRYKKTSE
ncbi:radical SAM protein [Candidatus Woesearchaeota archaeon]|nr:radical SAM protein [Candidatus Woesearchaeota archaeon]